MKILREVNVIYNVWKMEYDEAILFHQIVKDFNLDMAGEDQREIMKLYRNTVDKEYNTHDAIKIMHETSKISQCEVSEIEVEFILKECYEDEFSNHCRAVGMFN